MDLINKVLSYFKISLKKILTLKRIQDKEKHVDKDEQEILDLIENHSFNPISKYDMILLESLDVEVKSFISDRLELLQIPKNASEEIIEKWALLISDFLFELHSLKEKYFTKDQYEKIIAPFMEEMKYRNVCLIDSDVYNNVLQRAIDCEEKLDLSEIELKEKISYGVKFCGKILRKQEVSIYKPIK